MTAATVVQSMEHHLNTRQTHLSTESKLTSDVDYRDNPEEEPLLLKGDGTSSSHIGHHQSKTGSNLIKEDTAESIGDSLGSSDLGYKAEPVSGPQADKKSKTRKTDDAYENIWLRGEMLASYRQGKTETAGMSDASSQKVTLEESEYSQYWRGEVKVIRPEELQKESLTGIKTVSLIVPVAENLKTMEQSMLSTAITSAIIKGDNPLLLECIRQGENFNMICSRTGKSYLHVVTVVASPEQEVKFVPMIFQLSNVGIDLNIRDMSGETAIRIAVTRRLPQILAALLKCGAEFTVEDQYCLEQVKGVAKSEMMELVRRLTPSYWIAVHDPTPFKVHRLVKSWSRVNLSRNNLTLIEYAKQNVKDESIVKLLLQHEASIELAHAVMAGDSERVRVLLCHSDIDLDTRDASVKNNCFEPFAPLSLVGAAIKYDHADVLKVLRMAKANRKPYIQQRQPCGDNTEAGGDNSVLIKRGHSYEGAGVRVFHYSSAHGGSCQYRHPELLTTPSAVCDIL